MIQFLTTSIYRKITGGTVYNKQMISYLEKKGFSVTVHQLQTLNDFCFDASKKYLIDGILIQDKPDINRLLPYDITYIIHLWDSALDDVNKTIANTFKLIFTGENSLEYAQKNLGLTSLNYLTIEPGVSIKGRKKNYPHLPKKLLYVAGFTKGKGHEKLIELTSSLAKHNLEVDCYGEILDQAYYENFIQNKPKNITYKGTCKHEEIVGIYPNYDLLLLLSDYESYGMAVAEALQIGLPVIMTPVGNFKKYKKSNYKGIAEDFNVETLSDLLEQAVSDPILYQELIPAEDKIFFTDWETNFDPLHQFLAL